MRCRNRLIYLERDDIADDKAVIDSNSEVPGVGGEAARARLLVGVRELHRSSGEIGSVRGNPKIRRPGL